MAGSGESGGFLRSPLVLGGAAAVFGVVLALLLGGLGLFGTPTDATGSPSGSLAPSPSLVAVGSGEPSPGFSLDPGATVAPPTDAPTAPPTPKPSKTPKPTPTANTNPTILEFHAPKTVDCTEFVRLDLSWRIINATGVTLSIDGGGLYKTYPGFEGSDPDVPFGCDPNVRTHTYTLRTTGGTGPADEITRSVKWGAPKILSFEMGRADCPDTAATVGIDMRYEIRYATGAELWRDGALYSTYSSKVVDTSGIVFDCGASERTFTLITTGGYGSPATLDVIVKRRLP